MSYIELQVTTNFTFLRGASHPEELVIHAAQLGYTQIGITDRNSFAGIVRAHAAAKKAGIRIIPGCRLDLDDGPSLLAYPTSGDAYALLCTLLTTGNLRTEKGSCLLYRKDVFEHAKDVIFIAVPPTTLDENFEFPQQFSIDLAEYKSRLGNQLYLACSRHYYGDDSKQIFRLSQLSEKNTGSRLLPPMMYIIMMHPGVNYRIL